METRLIKKTHTKIETSSKRVKIKKNIVMRKQKKTHCKTKHVPSPKYWDQRCSWVCLLVAVTAGKPLLMNKPQQHVTCVDTG